MSTLGRNFGFLQTPIKEHRLGRFKTGDTVLPQGIPVKGTSAGIDATDGRRTVEFAGAAAAPLLGVMGILVWDEAWTNYHGYDPVLTRASDIDTVPKNTPAQVVHGTEVRVEFRNTVDRSFQGQRDYEGRTIIAISGLAVGDMLTPGVGNDTDGWWAETATASLAWLRVTRVDSTNGLVEAQMLF